MCIAVSWEIGAVPGGITDMESIRPGNKATAGLTTEPHMVSHCGNIGPKVGNELDDLVKPPFQGIKTGRECGAVKGRAITRHLPGAAIKYRVKAFRLPAKSNRQGFQGPATAPPLDGVPLDFSHYSQGDMRALGKLALSPAKLTHAVADHPRDRSPISRYAFGHVRTSGFHFQRRE